MPWYVLYTKSRNEKLVASKLQERGFEVYCPLLKTSRRWSDRIKWVQEPLFRSYCFVNLEENERAKVFCVSGIVRYLFWLNKPAIVREIEIAAIMRMLSEVDHHQIHLGKFLPNERVIINSGSFTETEGNVISHQGKILTVFIDSLQMVMRVDLSKNLVSA